MVERHAVLMALLTPSLTLRPVLMQSALRLKPAFTDAWNNIASALVQKGLIPQAIDCYAAALRINPRLVRRLHCSSQSACTRVCGAYDLGHNLSWARKVYMRTTGPLVPAACTPVCSVLSMQNKNGRPQCCAMTVILYS